MIKTTAVEIVIQGLALCYVDSSLWKMTLPFDKKFCHASRISYLEEGGKWTDPISVARSGNNLSIVHYDKDSKPVAPPNNMEYPKKMIDLSDNYARGGAVDLKPISSVDAVALSINSGEPGVFSYSTEHIFGLATSLDSDNAKITQTFSVLPTSLIFELTLNAGETLGIVSDSVSKTFNYSANGKHVIYVDNDCRDSSPQNDFPEYFKLINGDSFELEWIPEPVKDEYQTGRTYKKSDLLGAQRDYWPFNYVPFVKMNPLVRNYPCFSVQASITS